MEREMAEKLTDAEIEKILAAHGEDYERENKTESRRFVVLFGPKAIIREMQLNLHYCQLETKP
jgi:hypothetical protein